VLLCRDISFIFQTLAPFLAAVEIQPDRIEWLAYLGPRPCIFRARKQPLRALAAPAT
jgi:hypothetical protein